MLDLTGENLSTYLLRELRDIVNRNPRFRNMGGDVFVQANNMVQWGDLQVQISGITTSGNRLSPDYFMCTQHGHTVMAKLENKDGVFIEWVQENEVKTDETHTLTYPEPGVYYLNVDSVDEGTRDVSLTLQTYKWASGTSDYAVGSGIFFSPTINPDEVVVTDPSISYVHAGGAIYITSYTTQQPVALHNGAGPLSPNYDYWYIRQVPYVLTEATLTGYQDLTLPVTGYFALSITDQDGYELRDGIDFKFVAVDKIRLGEWTPPGSKLTATFTVKADPTTTLVMLPENMLPMTPLGPGETLTTGQVFIRSTFGPVYSESDLVIAGDGSLWLKNLLQRGERVIWEARVNAGQAVVPAKKLAINKNIIPGLSVAIGDMVNVDDQCVIMVSPDTTETYEVFGSKENISFDIRVKANDRLTASDIATMIRSHLLVRDRNEMEANGLTVFEVTKSSLTEQKDQSGVSPTTTYTLSVSAAADWELYVPLITRIGYLDIVVEDPTANVWSMDFPGKPTILPRLSALGGSQFLPYYM